jgi:predicted secreted protein
MKIGSALAIYFIIWWVTLFAVLPFGVRNAAEAGETVQEGHDPGAPVKPDLLRKAIITTLISALIFAGVYGLLNQPWFSIIDLPIARS